MLCLHAQHINVEKSHELPRNSRLQRKCFGHDTFIRNGSICHGSVSKSGSGVAGRFLQHLLDWIRKKCFCFLLLEFMPAVSIFFFNISSIKLSVRARFHSKLIKNVSKNWKFPLHIMWFYKCQDCWCCWTKRECQIKRNWQMEIEIEIQIEQTPATAAGRERGAYYKVAISIWCMYTFECIQFNNRFHWRFFRIEILSIKTDVRNVISFSFSFFLAFCLSLCRSLPIVRTLAAQILITVEYTSFSVFSVDFFYYIIMSVCMRAFVWMCIWSCCPHRSP